MVSDPTPPRDPVRRELRGRADVDCLEALHTLLELTWTEAPDVDADDRVRLGTALGELVGNVVEHGRTPSGAVCQLALVIEVDDALILALLNDDGAPVDPAPESARLPDDPLAESGRGVALARAAVDRLEYTRSAGQNEWRVEVRRAGR